MYLWEPYAIFHRQGYFIFGLGLDFDLDLHTALISVLFFSFCLYRRHGQFLGSRSHMFHCHDFHRQFQGTISVIMHVNVRFISLNK